MEVTVIKDICYLVPSSLIQCLTPRYDATLKNFQDDRNVLITSDLHLRGDFSPWTYFELSYITFISSFHVILIITLVDHPRIGWCPRIGPLGHRPCSYSFNSTF